MADVTKRKAMPSLSEEKIGVEEEEKRASESNGFLCDLILFLSSEDFSKQSKKVETMVISMRT